MKRTMLLRFLWLTTIGMIPSVTAQDIAYSPRNERAWGYMLQFGYHSTDSAYFNNAYEIDYLVGPRFSYLTIGLAGSVMWWPFDESHTMEAVKPWLPDNALNPKVSQPPLPAASLGIGILADLPLTKRASVVLLSSVRFMLGPAVSVKWDEELATPLARNTLVDYDESIEPSSRTIGRVGAHISFEKSDTLSSPFFGINFQHEIGGTTATFRDAELENFNVNSIIIYGGWLL